MQVVELGTEQKQQATFSIYHQNCTTTFKDKCHHIHRSGYIYQNCDT